MVKLAWSGSATSVQPRIRLSRSFDERVHSYLGYVVQLDGVVDGVQQPFGIGLGCAAYAKHSIRVGDELTGLGEPVPDPETETADLYKVTQLKVESRAAATDGASAPPWLGVAPPLPTYRARGHRRLAAKTYDSARCSACIWGCRMPVEIAVDHWNPGRPRRRFESFCYGPLSCPSYKPGPPRTVPGRNGMKFIEEDWIDEDAVSHRAPDE